jgi:hypothetical protein
MLVALDGLSVQIRELEQRLDELVEVTPEMQWLETLPGVGVILAATIALEVSDVRRFATAERLASYAGTTPRVHASGDRLRYGRTRPDVNRYLKWAFAEAGNSAAVNHRRYPERHVSELYFRLRQWAPTSPDSIQTRVQMTPVASRCQRAGRIPAPTRGGYGRPWWPKSGLRSKPTPNEIVSSPKRMLRV